MALSQTRVNRAKKDTLAIKYWFFTIYPKSSGNFGWNVNLSPRKTEIFSGKRDFLKGRRKFRMETVRFLLGDRTGAERTGPDHGSDHGLNHRKEKF